MTDETSIKSGEEGGEQIEFLVSEDRIFIKGLWKGRTSKSKKGNMNMSWHRRAMFDDALNAYLKIRKSFIDNTKSDASQEQIAYQITKTMRATSSTDDEEVPF